MPDHREVLDKAANALEPFVMLAGKRDAAYRKRGGDPEVYGATHPAYGVKADDLLRLGVWRNAREALASIRELLAAPAVSEPAEVYIARVAMLRQHAKRAKHVTEEEVLDIASMDADELRRRAIVNRDWHRLYASCLDGLSLVKYGATPDGCWEPRGIRRVVEQLLARASTTPAAPAATGADMVLVPRVADAAMLDAGLACHDGSSAPEDELAAAWRAMLAAAPGQQEGGK